MKHVAISKIIAGAKLDDCFLQRSVCILGSTSNRKRWSYPPNLLPAGETRAAALLQEQR